MGNCSSTKKTEPPIILTQTQETLKNRTFTESSPSKLSRRQSSISKTPSRNRKSLQGQYSLKKSKTIGDREINEKMILLNFNEENPKDFYENYKGLNERESEKIKIYKLNSIFSKKFYKLIQIIGPTTNETNQEMNNIKITSKLNHFHIVGKSSTSTFF